MQNKIFLIEDHDQALNLWRKDKIKGIDLVHIDAHIDFGFYPAKPIEEIFNKAANLEELKRNLEYTLAFRHYEKNLDKQTNIGNYIYPAMKIGIVKDFYWVVPGGSEEFQASFKLIKNILNSLSMQDLYRYGRVSPSQYILSEGMISSRLFGRNFIICTLGQLPVLRQNVLLDIDTDFLIIDSLLHANNTEKIGKRKPWISPENLVEQLRERVSRPAIITIAYSVNGGYTPISYKHLGDEIAYSFSPKQFRAHFRRNLKAAEYFAIFSATQEKEYYNDAIKLNPTYRAGDNNYGPLYLRMRKFSKARKEFLRILSADPKNPFSLCGLGDIELENNDFKNARSYFSSALKEIHDGVCSKARIQGLLGLAIAEFKLKNIEEARQLLFSYKTAYPLSPHGYYLLARIYEKERNLEEALAKYKDALRLGLVTIDVINRFLKIALRINAEHGIIQYITITYKEFKGAFLRTKRLNFRRHKKVKGLHNVEKKMASIEKTLKKLRHKRNKEAKGIFRFLENSSNI